MKLLLLLAFVASAYSAYFEPGELPCNCSVSGDPILSTFDNSILLIIKQQKTLLSRWNNDPDEESDPCKFQLRVVTQKEIGSDEGAVYAEWIGFGFDIHPSNNKQNRNVLIGQNLTHIIQRGKGFDGGELHPLPYSYSSSGMDLEVFTEGDGWIRVRSNTCPYAIDFKPDDRETRFNLYVGDKFRDNTMVGMCGNCNGVGHDDYRTCPNKTHESVVTEADDKFFVISDSCQEGKHQGWNYIGGNKI